MTAYVRQWRGQWEAYCPEVDVVTLGNTRDHALEMLREAVAIVVEDDLSARRDPWDRGVTNTRAYSRAYSPACFQFHVSKLGQV